MEPDPAGKAVKLLEDPEADVELCKELPILPFAGYGVTKMPLLTNNPFSQLSGWHSMLVHHIPEVGFKSILMLALHNVKS